MMFSRLTFGSLKALIRSSTFQGNVQKLPSRHLCSHESLRTLLPHRTDSYGALHFDLSLEEGVPPINPSQFEQLVDLEIKQIPQEIRSMWFRIATKNVNLIEPLVKLGFEFHHTKPNYLVLVKAFTQTGNIPKYPYTNVGVGALVIDEQMQILVIKEKHFHVRQIWKFPGGYVEQNEELSCATEREVLEETGIRCKFEALLLIRHMHKFTFDCSDFYFVCLCTPLSKEIRQCTHEIHDCEWAPLVSIREQMSPFNRFAIDKYLEWKGSDISIGTDTLDPYFASMSKYTVYSIKSQCKTEAK